MSKLPNQEDTIAAIATPIGRGGIGIVRISGTLVTQIAVTLLGQLPTPRSAFLTTFRDLHQEAIDQGIALYFPAPHSFTGEDVLELQGHGGIVVMDNLLSCVLQAGARLARPGEFSERAFLNGKIDLTQAEAIADLIDSASTQAARCAVRSLQGEFSTYIHVLLEQLVWLRSYVEASIDFVEEEIDFLASGQVVEKISTLLTTIDAILAKAYQGFLLREGFSIALVGEPNVGKSSLLNCLAKRDAAIVTPLPGTTRDTIQEHIQLDGMPLHLVDTAGLRATDDLVEQEGIKRTLRATHEADLVLLLLDNRHLTDAVPLGLFTKLPLNLLIVRNKIDLTEHSAGLQENGTIYLSVKTGAGIDILKQCLKEKAGFNTQTEGNLMARRRHLDALQRAQTALHNSLTYTHSLELLAEELRRAQHALGEITGEFTSDDLLERIFSSFCIGK